MEKSVPSYTVGGNVNWYNHSGEQCGGSSENSISKLPYDTAIPLLDTYLDKTVIQKDTHTPMFIAALFTMAKTWKQPKCPLTDDWINKMWYIYTAEYYSAIKKKEMMLLAATWTDLEIIILSEVSQRDKYMISLIYGI